MPLPAHAALPSPVPDAVDDEIDIARLADSFETRGPEELLAWAIGRWGDRLTLATAFQAEGMVLLDLAWRMDPEIRVVTLDTGRLPQETHDLIDRVRRRYGIAVEVVYPDGAALQKLVRRDGANGFFGSVEARLACCRTRKVEPMRRALAGSEAWIAGLRREQSAARAGVAKVERDPVHAGPRGDLIKLNPLADWSLERVWRYVEEHDVPYHGLYDQGYASIGCAPCTRAVRPGQASRAGRWWWENGHKECGLHLEAPATAAGDRR